MKKYLVAILLLSFGVAYAADYPTNIAGNYDCKSIEIGAHDSESCEMTIKKTGETYFIKSIFKDGTTYTGTGIYEPVKHIFSFAFINPKNAAETGVVVADVNKDYSMTSKWTYLNKNKIGYGAAVKR